MTRKNIVDKETLLPLGFVIAIISTLFLFFTKIYSEAAKTEVQAAEINFIKKDYNEHKKLSERYFMSISKSLSRIEGQLDSKK